MSPPRSVRRRRRFFFGGGRSSSTGPANDSVDSDRSDEYARDERSKKKARKSVGGDCTGPGEFPVYSDEESDLRCFGAFRNFALSLDLGVSFNRRVTRCASMDDVRGFAVWDSVALDRLPEEDQVSTPPAPPPSRERSIEVSSASSSSSPSSVSDDRFAPYPAPRRPRASSVCVAALTSVEQRQQHQRQKRYRERQRHQCHRESSFRRHVEAEGAPDSPVPLPRSLRHVGRVDDQQRFVDARA